MKKKTTRLLTLLLVLSTLAGCAQNMPDTLTPTQQAPTIAAPAIPESNDIDKEKGPDNSETQTTGSQAFVSNIANIHSDIPAYSGEKYAVINNNVPFFSEDDMTTESFETYSEMDTLGRCGVAFACVGIDIMPTEPRGEIGMIKPSGWHTIRYDCVDGQYLYNRCHLLGYQLTGENANEKNLITGTRYLNTEGMLPFENQVADYVQATQNHVMYRVTPLFDGDNLLADGVLMEAKSVEDSGKGVLFNVFVYNVQPGVSIDYTSGDSELEPAIEAPADAAAEATEKKE